ncbi:MAG TPA: phosphotransferase family protein [Acidimicrobiia bacterium]|nr:phosphotransferase family protein [Acidimicrobiia bacterium]
MTGGASRETWSFDAVHPDGEREGLILRRDRAGGLGATAETERRLLEVAGNGGVAVPRVVRPLDDGYVMERVDGETIPRKILRDDAFATARPALARQVGEIAARIHALPLDAVPSLPGFDGFEHPALAQVHQYRAVLDAFGEPHPVFELGLRWIERHVPPVTGTALVHGDFRNGNFVVGPEGVRAVLDWELAHLGDPMEDLGWLCVRSWRFRQVDKPVGGFGEYADLFAGYEAVSGKAVDPEVVRYWEVFGTLKWGEMCIVQAFTHLNGLHRSVELAAIGRRVCEMEWHLLEMIG